MAEEKNSRDTLDLTPEERTRSTPKTGAEESATQRDRTSELPATENLRNEKLAKLREEVDATAHQVADGNVREVQGKLAVPRAKVMKRGSTKWTDEEGNVHKELNDEEVNAPLAEDEIPEYLELHKAVLEGADPIKATLDFQGRKKEEAFSEAKLEDAELHPRTGAISVPAEEEEE